MKAINKVHLPNAFLDRARKHNKRDRLTYLDVLRTRAQKLLNKLNNYSYYYYFKIYGH